MPAGRYSNETIQDFLTIAQVHGPRILAALFGGGLIGAENQVYGKSAGLRTSLLVAVACCVITTISIETSYLYGGEAGRITAQIVSGIGFLGGGVILQQRGRITGITTAASIFVAAAIGIVAGSGFIFSAVAIAGIAFLILLALRPVDYFIDRYQPFLRLRERDRNARHGKRRSAKIAKVVQEIKPEEP